jgi:hypothetical protein
MGCSSPGQTQGGLMAGPVVRMVTNKKQCPAACMYVLRGVPCVTEVHADQPCCPVVALACDGFDGLVAGTEMGGELGISG